MFQQFLEKSLALVVLLGFEIKTGQVILGN
jgi:hypothetical protein